MKTYIEKTTAMLKQAGLNHKYVPAVFDDSLKAKEDINALLGLSEENLFRKQITLETTDVEFFSMYPWVLEVFRNIPGWSGELKPTTGKLTVGNNQVNITKFLSKALEDNTIPPDYKTYMMGKMNIDKYSSKADSQIVPKFGELLNKKANNVVVISTNPFDFFTSSAGEFKYASFKSCYRPGGEYFNGCNSLSRDNFSTITYKASADKLDYKHGRAWMFLLDQMVALTKSYGTFSPAERKIAREFVQGKLAEKHEISAADYKFHGVKKWGKKSNSKVLYFDDYSIDLGYLPAKYPKGFSDEKVPEIKFSNAKCLKCGRETQYPTQGLCGVCSGNHYACYDCNVDLYGGKDLYVEGRHYCEKCGDGRFDECGECGRLHEKGTAVTVGDREVCPQCLREYYYFCDHCKTYHKTNNERATTVGTERWCKACTAKDAFLCGDCKVYHPTTVAVPVTIDGGVTLNVCDTCIKFYSVCEKCKISFKGGHSTCDGTICSKCFAGYEFCIQCKQFVPSVSMTFDGKEISCESCATARKSTEGSHEGYLKEIESILADIATAEKDIIGDTVAALQRDMEDRVANGYRAGDILRVTTDTSYHGIPLGTLVTCCVVKEGVNAIKAVGVYVKNELWFIKTSDVTFARPELVPGDVYTVSGKMHTLQRTTVSENASRIYTSIDNINTPADACSYTDIIDPKALAAVKYTVGEVVDITNTLSRHPFKVGDKVKVMYVSAVGDHTRYIVKKGTKFGYIFGAVADIAKSAPAKVVTPKVPTAKMPKKAPHALDLGF